MPDIPMATRLAKYGLTEATLTLTDLKVAKGVEFALSRENREIAKNVRELKPASIAELKEWLGVPTVERVAQPHGMESAVHALLPRSGIVDYHKEADIVRPLPAKLTKAHTNALYAAAHQYVMTDYPLEESVIKNLDKWIVSMKPSILLFHFKDIHVAAGAQLVINPSNAILFARHIVVEKTGRIIARGTTTKINCSDFKGN